MKARAIVLLALLAVACKRYDAERDAALKQRLTQMRAAITRYRAEQGHEPPSLEALVPRYLPAIPVDPFTQDRSWRVETEDTVQPSSDFTTGTAAAPSSVVIDVHSSAPGADRNGVLYSNY